MQSYFPIPDTTIDEVAREMVELADIYGEHLIATFNGVPLKAKPGSSQEKIIQHYTAVLKCRAVRAQRLLKYQPRTKEATNPTKPAVC